VEAPFHSTRERPLSRARAITASRAWTIAVGSSPAQLKAELRASAAGAVSVGLGELCVGGAGFFEHPTRAGAATESQARTQPAMRSVGKTLAAGETFGVDGGLMSVISFHKRAASSAVTRVGPISIVAPRGA
jgi:hypothetical protein